MVREGQRKNEKSKVLGCSVINLLVKASMFSLFFTSAEYTLRKSIVQGSTKQKGSGENEGSRLVVSPTPVNTKEYEKQNSLEKQKAYQDAFLDQMNQYIKYGELESKNDDMICC